MRKMTSPGKALNFMKLFLWAYYFDFLLNCSSVVVLYIFLMEFKRFCAALLYSCHEREILFGILALEQYFMG